MQLCMPPVPDACVHAYLCSPYTHQTAQSSKGVGDLFQCTVRTEVCAQPALREHV